MTQPEPTLSCRLLAHLPTLGATPDDTGTVTLWPENTGSTSLAIHVGCVLTSGDGGEEVADDVRSPAQEQLQGGR